MTNPTEEARKAAFEAAEREMFRGKTGQWTGSGPGNVSTVTIDAFLAHLDKAGMVSVPRAILDEVKRLAGRTGNPESDFDGGFQACAQRIWDDLEPWAAPTASTEGG